MASLEDQSLDRFLGLWVALEALVGGIEYAKVFDGKRANVKESIIEQLRRVDYETNSDSIFELTSELFENRISQNDWPLPKKLELFAKSHNIELDMGDQSLVRELGRVRGNILHSGESNLLVTDSQLSSLKNLVERLIIASGVCAYSDLEEEKVTTLKMGSISPEGGAAPISVDGRRVEYVANGYRGKSGALETEYWIDGKVFDETNSRIN